MLSEQLWNLIVIRYDSIVMKQLWNLIVNQTGRDTMIVEQLLNLIVNQILAMVIA